MMSYDELKAVFTGILDKQNIPHTWHSFIQIPKNHCFGTYNISEADFDGADLVAMYRHDTISLCLFYHDGKTDEDLPSRKSWKRLSVLLLNIQSGIILTARTGFFTAFTHSNAICS